MAKALTDRQRETLAALMQETEERGGTPALREVGDRLGITTAQGVKSNLIALAQKGYVEIETGARIIRVLKDPEGRRVRLAYVAVGEQASGN